MELSLTVAGRGLTLTPVRLGQLPAFVRAVEPFAKQIASGHLDPFELLADHGVNVIRALEVATREPRDWIESLAMDDAVALVAAVLEVNADFFVQRVMPALQDAMQRIATIPAPASLPTTATGSSTSPVAASATPTQ